MKKQLIIFLLIFSISLVTAVPTLTLQNPNTQPGETLLGIITLDYGEEFTTPITKEDIEFSQGRKKILFESDIIFHENKYYFYAYLTRLGNLTLKINKILYKQAEELKEKTIEKEIQIKKNFTDTNNTQYQILSIKPGFVFTTDQAEITLTNLGTSRLNLTYNDKEASLPLQEGKIIYITPEQTFSELTIETYKTFTIPIIFIPLEQDLVTNFRPSKKSLQLKLIEGQEHTESIKLFNFAEKNITNIVIEKTLSFLETNQLEYLPAKSSFNLTLTFSPKKTGHYSDSLNFTFTENSREKSLSIPLDIYVFPEDTDLENPETQSCSELQGTLCGENQKCEGEEKYTGNFEFCCIGECTEIKQKTSLTWLWAFLIFLALATAGFFIYKKFKKTTPITSDEKLKQTSESYEKKVTGQLDGT